jgi:hypothetical protein
MIEVAGVIAIGIRANGAGETMLVVSDDGLGFPLRASISSGPAR